MTAFNDERLARLAETCLGLTETLETFADLMEHHPRDTREWWAARSLLIDAAACLRGASHQLELELTQ